jgi:hypothetical protein
MLCTKYSIYQKARSCNQMDKLRLLLIQALDIDEAMKSSAGNTVTVTLEIELKVNGTMARL